MKWMYKTFSFKVRRGFAKADNPLQSDHRFERLLNDFSELGWEYVEIISKNIGFFHAKEYLVVLRAQEGEAFNTLSEKVLKEEQMKRGLSVLN